MTNIKSMVCICGLLLVGAHHSAAQRAGSDGLSLTVMVQEARGRDEPTFLWLVVKNSSLRTRLLCRQAWDFSMLPEKPDGIPIVERESSLYGCGDKSHDAFWILMPGETRVDSIRLDPLRSDSYSIDVSVDLNEYSLDKAAGPSTQTLRWTGRLFDAITAFKVLKH